MRVASDPTLDWRRDRDRAGVWARVLRSDLATLNRIAKKRDIPVEVLLTELLHGAVTKLFEAET
jgi:hypothetical protein